MLLFRRLFLLLVVLLASLGGAAQDVAAPTVTEQEHKDAFLSLQLPPLSQVIDGAVANNALRQYYMSRKEEERRLMKSIGREWMRYLKFEAQYRYGNLGLSSLIEDQVSLPIYSNQVQSGFQVGVNLQLPLLELWDLNNRLKRAKIKMNQSDHEMKRAEEEITEKVITDYNIALMQLEVLAIKAELLDVQNAQIIMSESNFLSGRLSISELARLKELQVKAKVDYENTKSAARTAIQVLEYLSGIIIIK